MNRRPVSIPCCVRSSSQIIRELTAAGKTVLLSSHVLTELEARTDLAAILREGRLVAFGDLETLRRQAGLPVTVRVQGDAPAIAAKLNGAFHKTVAPDRRAIEIDCPPAKKMALLRTLADFGELCSDLEVRPPSLDDLYLHFSGPFDHRSRRMETSHEWSIWSWPARNSATDCATSGWRAPRCCWRRWRLR